MRPRLALALCLVGACARTGLIATDHDTLPACAEAVACSDGGDGTLVVPIAFLAAAVTVPLVLHLVSGRRTASGARP